MKTLKHFVLRSQVLQLYRKAMRAANDSKARDLIVDADLKEWIRMEFRDLKTDDLHKIENRLSQGRVQLRNLENSILLARS